MDFKKKFKYVLLSLPLLLICITEPALAYDLVRIGDYQIQLFTDPDPLIAGKEANLIIKILRSQDQMPVRNGQIYSSIQNKFRAASLKRPDLNVLSEYQAITEADEFGNYELKTIFQDAGTYDINIAFEGREGKKFIKPLTAGFALTVNASVYSRSKLLFVLSTILVITLAALYLIYSRKRILTVESKGFNLLEIASLKRLLQSKYIQPVLQLPLLAVFIILLFLAFFHMSFR